MSKIRRIGLRREPQSGWPLDRLLVGVATLRTTRELYRLERETSMSPLRPWDIALWSGRLGLVTVASPDCPGCARTYRLDREHPLYEPLGRLFEAERAATRAGAHESVD